MTAVELRTDLIDIDMERIVLGCILREGASTFRTVAAYVGADDFAVEQNRFIFRTMADLCAAGTETRLDTVAEILGRTGDLPKVGGCSGLLDFDAAAIPGSRTDGLARSLKRLSIKRRLQATTEKLALNVQTGTLDGGELRALTDELHRLHREMEFQPVGGDRFSDCLAEVGGYDSLLSPPKRLVPFPWAGACVTGLAPGQLITIGGRASMGKTVVGCHVAIHAAAAGHRTLFASLEMSKGEMLRRLLSMVARIHHADLQTGRLGAADRRRVHEAGFQMNEWPLSISTDLRTLDTIAARLATARRDGAAYGLVVVDYLGLLQTAGRFENRNAEVSYLTRSLKILAGENDLPIVALSQLNRAPDARAGDHEPQLSDLRDSGSIEQDSDVVAFIHRPGYYKPTDRYLRNVARFIVRKQRNGPVGSIPLRFVPEFVQFVHEENPREQMEGVA